MNDPLLKPPAKGYDEPVLVPPGYREDKREQRGLIALFWSILGFVVLLGLAISLIWVQPQDLTRSIPSIQPIAEAATNKFAQQEKTQQNTVPLATSQLLGDWLRLLAIAESENVAAWGGNDFIAITATALAADKLLQEGKSAEGNEVYRHVINELKGLMASKQQRLNSALAEGNQALEQQNSETALNAYSYALSIEPDNQQGVKGMNRARLLDQVIALYQQGMQLEADNELDASRKAFFQAVQMDGDFVPAGSALARVEKRIVDIRFRKVLSNALLSLNQGDLQAASVALEKASRLNAKNPALVAAKIRLAAEQKSKTLQQFRDRADQLAASEQWAQAMHEYEQSLLVAPHASFAVEGRRLAQRHLKLDTQLRSIIDQPQRLKEDGPLEEARQTLHRARRFENPGPILLAQIEQLAALIKNASTLVPVVLSSDNATNIVVYQVGRLGSFLEKHLTLRPGNYTVVGSRPGFRDIRLTLIVKASKQPILLSIRCEEQV